jgi:hypothetical protein
MQWQVRHEWLPIIVVADQGREGMLAHEVDGSGNIIALELCWNVHGECSDPVIKIRANRAGLIVGHPVPSSG